MSRNTFDQELINARTRKLEAFNGAEREAVKVSNQAKIEAFLAGTDFSAFKALWVKFGPLFGMSNVNDHIASLKQGYRYGRSEEVEKLIGIDRMPERYTNDTIDTLLNGALATTKVKYWDGLYGPVRNYLNDIASSRDFVEVDAATMKLVEALA
jgi:hypothetical protein